MNIQSKTDLIQFLFKNDNWNQHKGEIKKFSILHVIISPRGVNKNENFIIESVSIFLPLSKSWADREDPRRVSDIAQAAAADRKEK